MPIQLNIYNRLAFVLWGAALLAFIVAGAGVVLFQSFTLEQRIRQIMEPYAQLVSVGTDAAVSFEDPVRAQEILDTLRANPQIQEAAIYLDGGRLLASFSRAPNATPVSLPSRPDGLYLDGDTAVLLQALPRGGRLRLSIGLDQLSRQTHQVMWIFGTGVLVLLLVTFAQLLVLRRTLVRPIANLTQATELVRASASYKHRVPASGTDEVAQLGKNFNAMMEAIQERENDLRRLTLFQRTILDNVAYCIISTTPEGIVTSFNPAAERLLGYTAGEMVGKQTPERWHDPEEIANYARQLSLELGETVQPGFEVFAARPRRHLTEENEWAFICKDGRRIPVNLSVTALRDEEGRITGFVGLGYDLTERKRVEDALLFVAQRGWQFSGEDFFNALAQFLGEKLDMDYVLIDRIEENPDMAETVALYAKGALAPNMRYALKGTPCENIMGKRLCVYPHGVQQLFPEDTLLPAMGAESYIGIPLWDSTGKPIGLIAVMGTKPLSDDASVTQLLQLVATRAAAELERKHAEAEIRKLNNELEQRVVDRTAQLEAANSELEAFSYSVSHDLRTPLRAIDGFSKILLDGYIDKLDEEGKRLLGVVRDNTSRMGQLIDDMLKFSRTGRVELAFSRIDMGNLARAAFEELQPSAGDNKAQLEIGPLPPARGDRAMMHQVFINLFSNAIKFSRGGGTPEIRVGATVNDGETIYFVRDNGVGFNMQYADKLFGVFQRLHSINEFEGTGIGLAIVKRIITRHGGRVWAEGKINEGATIYFALPNRENSHE